MKRLILFLCIVPTHSLLAQTAVQFNSSSDNEWLYGTNWNGWSVPGSTAIAVFGSYPSGIGSGNGCNINFALPFNNNGYNNQIVGGIRVLSTRARDMNIGNSSTTVDGTLTLNGVTIGGVSNVVVDNLMTSYNLHFNNVIVGTSRVMKLALGTNAIFNGVTNSITEINAQVTSATNVTVNGGELQLNRSGGSTFPSSTNFTVSDGALRISTDQTIANLDLASGTTLYVETGATLTISGTFTNRGATITTTGTGKVTYGTSSTLDYAATSAQTSGSEWPTVNGPKNVSISNTNGLSMSSNHTMVGTLTVNSVLNVGTYQLNAGSVVVNSGGTLKLGSTSSSGAIAGNLGSTSLTLNSGSTVEFNGSGLQYTPALTYSNLTVNNGSYSLALAGNVTVSGALTLNTSTKLDLNGKAVTLGGSVSGTGTFKGSSTSGLAIASTGAAGTLTFDQTTDGATNALATLAVSSGSAILGSKLQLYTSLTLSSGTLDLAAKNLVLKSTATQTAYVAEIKGTLTGESNVTVERYSPAWSSRRYRIVTAPVSGTTINAAWQEGSKWNGSAALSSTGYGVLITGQAQGNATTANGNGFDYWSATATASASIRTYAAGTTSAQASWQAVSSTLTANAFDNHQAYLVYVRGERTSTYAAGSTAGTTTLRATGTLKKGSYTISVPYNKSHTLIGNPYASPLDFKALYDANSTKIQSSFWIWQSSLGSGTGGYVLVRPVSGSSSLYETIPGDGSQTTANRIIHSGEGFFVMPNASATAGNSITLQEAHKSTTTPTVSVFRQIVAPAAKLYVNLYAATDSTNVLLDGVLSQYSDLSTDDTTASVGNGNTQKAVNSSENLSLLQDGNDWIVTASAAPKKSDTLQLRIWNTAVKTYQLQIRSANFAALGVTPVLVDNYLNKTTVINTADARTTYTFSITSDAASKDALRFFIVYKAAATLPLSITNLRAEEKSKSVNVKWRVADETGIKSYAVESSTNGTNFKTLAVVRAKAGSGEQAYEQLDQQPSASNYYRIKMIGTTGEVTYSSVVKVQLQKSGETVATYPNPVSGPSFSLQLVNKPQGEYTVTLYNTAGQVMLRKTLQHNGGSATETISLDDLLTNGTYYLYVKDPDGGSKGLNISLKR